MGHALRRATVAIAMTAGLSIGAVVLVLEVAIVPVLSPSMRPAIAEGDLLLVRPLATAELEVDQVALLSTPDDPDRTFAHRLIDVQHGTDGTIVRTRGDANPEADPDTLVITAETTTVMLGRIPRIGHVALAVDPAGPRLVVTLGIVALLVIAARRTLARRTEG
jgi:signal peptidase I